ncbi:MAG: hypothetical protein Ct9H300mP32_5510 [Verrucomicrobiota bacterium]|nr:MAG: hypothetical protein Ct9H300mP32_5510 [Verrucomicrobiota bacterium]
MKKQSILVVVGLALRRLVPHRPITSTHSVQDGPKPTTVKPGFPSYTTVIKGYEQIISSMDKKSSLFSIYVRKKDQQMLGVLPAGFESKKFFIATTVASGETYAGLRRARSTFISSGSTSGC